MNKLIKNELIKIFNKKSIYIMFAILLLFVLLTNLLYKYKLDDYGNLKENTYNKEHLNELYQKLDNTNDINNKLSLKKEILTQELYLKYGIDSWQAYIIENNMSDIINEVIENNNEYIKEEYDIIISKFDTNDWKYFVELELDNINNEILKLNKDDYIYKSLYIDKEVLEYRLKNNIDYSNNYLNKELDNYSIYKKKALEKNNKYDNYINKSTSEISKYIVDNNINSNKISDTRGILKNFFIEYELIIVIIIIMIGSVIISQEFNTRTIKQLLITPHSRNKILLSKYITLLLIILITILLTFIFQIVIGGIFFGFSSLKIPVIIYNFNKNTIFEYNILHYLFILILSKIPMFILIGTITLFVSIISLSSNLSIIIGILLYVFSNIINTFALNIKFLKYFITPNWDLSYYLYGMVSQNTNINLCSSIIITIIYIFIFIILSFIIFKRKEIKNI